MIGQTDKILVVFSQEMFSLRGDCKTYGKVLTSYQSGSGSQETGDLALRSHQHLSETLPPSRIQDFKKTLI